MSKTIDRITLYFLLAVIFIFVGYAWRLHHESKQAEARYQRHIYRFLEDIYNNPSQFYIHGDYLFQKLPNGAILIERRKYGKRYFANR